MYDSPLTKVTKLDRRNPLRCEQLEDRVVLDCQAPADWSSLPVDFDDSHTQFRDTRDDESLVGDGTGPRPSSDEDLHRVKLVLDNSSTDPANHGDHTMHGTACGCPDCVGRDLPVKVVEQDPHQHGPECGHELRLDAFGNEYYFDAIPPIPPDEIVPEHGSVDLGLDTISPEASAPDMVEVPAFSSRPGSPYKLLLDFDGHVVSGTYWNSKNQGNPIHAPAYSRDSDLTTFSGSEQVAIQEIWQRVAEDFAPFNLDVTTIDPGEEAFTAGGQALRVLISTATDQGTNHEWYPSAAGGVAYRHSWHWPSDTPVWVFENRLGNGSVKYVAEAASHEAGHGFGLGHDGVAKPKKSYYRGHGTGATSWAPIMGSSYHKSVTQWSSGDYLNASNTQDDVAVIAKAVGFAKDDHGDIFAAATPLTSDSDAADTITAEGLIATADDRDLFRFQTKAGQVRLNLLPFAPGTSISNLDIQANLYDHTYTLIASANPSGSLEATLDLELAAGTYYLEVDGVGLGDPLDQGYSDYGSLGRYTLIGSVVGIQGNTAPVANLDQVFVSQNQSVVIDVLANDLDGEGDTLRLQSVSTPLRGMVTLVNGQLVYTPKADYVGTDRFTYVVSDGLLSTTGTVRVLVQAPQSLIDPGHDDVSTVEGIGVTIDVLANDEEKHGGTLWLESVNSPGHGIAALVNGKVVYIPRANFVGHDRFTYVVTDGISTVTGTVTVTVTQRSEDERTELDPVSIADVFAVRVDGMSNAQDFVPDPSRPDQARTTRNQLGNNLPALWFDRRVDGIQP